MAYTLTASPAYTVRPGTMVLPDGIIFSAVFHDCKSCGLHLYHLPDLEQVTIPFTDDYRYGSLYSMKIDNLSPLEWGYRYYTDKETFCDPYARELLPVTIDGKEITLSRPFPYPENTLPAYGSRGHRKWSERVMYCVHVQGFTASRTAHCAHKGTFRGLVDKIPYLQKLGVNALELMPVYELREHKLAEPVKENYWNFGEGCYFAPKRAYADCSKKATQDNSGSSKNKKSKLPGNPQTEFYQMVKAMHEAGIEVFLQLFFPDNVAIQTQLETARFYVTHYGIDGFHLKGNSAALQTIASDPMLSDTALFYYSFPYEELQKKDRENPNIGRPSVRHLCEYTDDFQTLARRFVKSDNQVLREFVKAFITVPAKHGSVHYVTNYEGFTLMDLVSYNWKHNDANGEDNRDGNDTNWSWNCGIEGPTHKKDIRALRNRQMRNLMTLNLLAQGTPLILAGDERCNTQSGNNNPYCQNNETGWVNWKETTDSKAMLRFTQQLLAFRREHAVFRRSKPFTFNDPKAIGYPDISTHGKEAWKPDLSGYSHTVGILLPEIYAEENPQESFLYLALNMHWHEQRLALPKLPAGYRWHLLMDTFQEDPFVCEETTGQKPLAEKSADSVKCTGKKLEDQHGLSIRGRSIQILQAVKCEVEKPQGMTSRKKHAQVHEKRAEVSADTLHDRLSGAPSDETPKDTAAQNKG